MQDRVSLYPGRVTLTPVAGQANTYDMVRADQPTQEGTPLNKASLLSDDVAAVYDLSNAAVPNDVLSMLSRFQHGLGNEHVWRVVDGAWGVQLSSTADKITLIQGTESNPINQAYIRYSADVKFGKNGNVSLKSPVTKIRGEFSESKMSAIVGTYVQKSNVSYDAAADEPVYYATSYTKDQGYYLSVKKVSPILNADATFFANASGESDYPPSTDDGNIYTYLGQLGGGARVEAGSYAGTGKYGWNNPNTLSFLSPPYLLFIWTIYSDVSLSLPYLWPTNYESSYGPALNNSGDYAMRSGDGKVLSWYNTESAAKQSNVAGTTYYYVAVSG